MYILRRRKKLFQPDFQYKCEIDKKSSHLACLSDFRNIVCHLKHMLTSSKFFFFDGLEQTNQKTVVPVVKLVILGKDVDVSKGQLLVVVNLCNSSRFA